MTTSAYAQTEVLTGVTRGKDYGVVYSLPKTQIELEIKANKVNYTPGEFSKYADRYLRLTNVSADPEEYWELASVKVKSVGVPNSETTYFVKLKDKTVAPLMELTKNGIVKTINVPYSNSSAGNTLRKPWRGPGKCRPVYDGRYDNILYIFHVLFYGGIKKYPNVDRVMDIKIISVDESFRGQGVCKALIDKTM